jgi:inorganic pyrophosphatase
MMANLHPWHDIDIGEESPEFVNMVVEIPKDSQMKYELDKKTGLLRIDRAMYSAVHYPGDYGFIPKTLWYDNDPLDIFVFTNNPTYPLTLCEVRVIGVVHMHDNKESDDKILAVHKDDPRYQEWISVKKMPKHYLRELTHFLETYKELQGKEVKVFEIKGPKTAYACINEAKEMYEKKYSSKK